MVLRVSKLDVALEQLGSRETFFDVGSEGIRLGVVEAAADVEYDLDHVALYSADPTVRRRST